MRINDDFLAPVFIDAAQHVWIPSPQQGVERVLLDRIGAEQARATSLVRYAPASRFPLHPHPGGEEIFVLSGVFSDADGDYPAGWYLRNPPQFRHAPSSEPGALIFVKLRQMPETESLPVRIDTRLASNWRQGPDRAVCLLHALGEERVELQRVGVGQALIVDASKGAELLVLDGRVDVAGRRLHAQSWMRLPPAWNGRLVAGPAGATAYLKTGHLAEPIGA